MRVDAILWCGVTGWGCCADLFVFLSLFCPDGIPSFKMPAQSSSAQSSIGRFLFEKQA